MSLQLLVDRSRAATAQAVSRAVSTVPCLGNGSKKPSKYSDRCFLSPAAAAASSTATAGTTVHPHYSCGGTATPSAEQSTAPTLVGLRSSRLPLFPCLPTGPLNLNGSTQCSRESGGTDKPVPASTSLTRPADCMPRGTRLSRLARPLRAPMWMGLLTAAVLWPAMQVPTMATAALRGMGERAAVWSAFSGGNEGSNASDVRAALMAVGDLHGDLQQAVAALRLAGAMGSDGRWAGGRGTLVQTGDALDRGNDSLAVLGLLARLQEEAASAGGEVVLLAGNHELMNLAGDLRYVAPGELAWLSRNVTDATSAGTTEDAYDPMDVRRGLALWRRAIAPDAPAGIALRSRRVVAIAGRGACRTLFVHAGLTEPVLRQAAELGTSLHQPAGNGSLAAAADAALSGALRTCFTDGDPEGGSDGGADMYGPRKRWKACPGGSVENTEALTILQSAVGPLWLRSFVEAPKQETCRGVAAVLAAAGAHRMVVGHNRQAGGRPRSRCGGTLHMIDVGLSRAYGGYMAAWQCELDESGAALARAIVPDVISGSGRNRGSRDDAEL